MKERLDQYTMAQFIDIVCGDYSHICSDAGKAKAIAESLIAQYNEVSDSVSSKAHLIDAESFVRCGAKIKFYSILLNLINVFNAYTDVRGILDGAGYVSVAKRDDIGMKAKIEQLLRSEESARERMKHEQKEKVKDNVDEIEIRASFDKQTAQLMSHFKFAINHETISASVYANLVNTCIRQRRQQVQ